MPHDLYKDLPPPDLQVLLDWLELESVEVHSNVEVRDIPDAGWGVRAKGAIDIDEPLLRVPKPAVLSHRTSALQLPREVINPPTPTLSGRTLLILSLCVLYEMQLGADSRWYGYLQSLPRETVMVPMFWGNEDIVCSQAEWRDGEAAVEWLRGTDAERDLAAKAREGLSIDALTAFYSAYSHYLTERSPDSPSGVQTVPPFAAFAHAFSLVSTRAFVIDLHHTIALVPFADIFNHSSDPHTGLQSDPIVCHVCGSLPECTHDIPNSYGIARRLEEMTDEYRVEVERLGRQLGPKGDTVDMLLEKPAELGSELYNTYGSDLSDARLLVEWGFIEGEYAGEGITWDESDLTEEMRQHEDLHRQLSYDVTSALKHLRPSGGSSDEYESDSDSDNDEGVEGRAEAISQDPKWLYWPRPYEAAKRSIRHSSEISVGLLVTAAMLAASDPSSVTPAQITKAIQLITAVTPADSDSDPGQTSADPARIAGSLTADDSPKQLLFACRTARELVALLETRLASLHRSQDTLARLFEVRDALPAEARLERMAMTLNLNERSLLEPVLQNWQDILTALDARNIGANGK